MAYTEYADKTVPYQTAQASAAIYVFKDAFELAGTLDKEAVRDALTETDLATFCGQIKFSEAGNNVAKPNHRLHKAVDRVVRSINNHFTCMRYGRPANSNFKQTFVGELFIGG